MRQMLVHFEGEGSGEEDLSWGQVEILGAMRRQRTKMPLPFREPLPPGTTLEHLAEWVRYIMGRHQAMRTRLRHRADGTQCQVVFESGDFAVDVVEAGDEDPVKVAQRLVDQHVDYVEHDFDFASDWPLLLAVILCDGVPTHRVVTICHIVIDVSGGLALAADLAAWQAGTAEGQAGGAVRPVTAMQPLEQARWQHSPEGERHMKTVLRYWEDVLRRMPARWLPPPVDRGEPRYWRLRFVSPATHLAVQLIRSRTGATSAQVILTAFLVASARVTGVDQAVTRVAVNNRFRRGLADSVSIVIQYGLCMVDVGGVTFDEALVRLGRRLPATLKHAYYDPRRIEELAERIGRERGEEVDIHCYFNDRRLSPDADLTPGSLPTAAQLRAALPHTSATKESLWRATERVFAAVEEAPDTFHMVMEIDTHHLPYEDAVALARSLELAAVEAALDGESLR